MFVSNEKFIEAHAGRLGDMSIYGQKSNYTTCRPAGQDEPRSSQRRPLHHDKHPDLKADYVLSNPPFDDSDRRAELRNNRAKELAQ